MPQMPNCSNDEDAGAHAQQLNKQVNCVSKERTCRTNGQILGESDCCSLLHKAPQLHRGTDLASPVQVHHDLFRIQFV
jgi:hypothetical protein